MSKKKIADSIIIRVGGGIREVQRQSLETTGNRVMPEPGFEQTEDVHSFGAEPGVNTKKGSNKIVH